MGGDPVIFLLSVRNNCPLVRKLQGFEGSGYVQNRPNIY